MSLLDKARPRSQREALLSITLIVMVPVAVLLGLIGGQHLPPISSAPAVSPSPTAQASGVAEMAAEGAAGPLSADQMDARMSATTKAFPAKTAGVGAEVLQPKVPPDGTKQYELVAKITSWEESPGRMVQAWTYNGTVPGPTIHVNDADKVKVILNNQLPESTVIHFHGLIVPNAMDGVPDITQPVVKPGQSFTYTFVAKGPAVGMYHSHNDSAKQVTNGLAGAFSNGPGCSRRCGGSPGPDGRHCDGAPGQRFSVLIHADHVGTWAWHCHILTHAENASGMFGMVTALVVQ